MPSVVGVATTIPFLLALASLASYCGDQHRLSQVAARETLTVPPTKSARTIALAAFISHDMRCRKNFEESILAPRRGPTSAHILDHGGDCADKSQLLVAMLRTLDISATPVMLFDKTGRPSHTVVEVQLSPCHSMVVDPLWNLSFTKPRKAMDTLKMTNDEASGATNYFNVLDLRRDPTILWGALQQEQERAAPGAKILRYNYHADVYDAASTVNWDRDPMTRWLGAQLQKVLGDHRFILFRPAVLEEPEAFAAVAWFTLGVVLCLFRQVGLRRHLRRRA